MKGNKIMVRLAALALAAGVLFTDVSSIYAADAVFGGTADATEMVELTEATEIAGETESIEVAEATEEMETTEETQKVDETDATEMVELTEATEKVEETEETEAVEEMEETEAVEETEETEKVEETEETWDTEMLETDLKKSATGVSKVIGLESRPSYSTMQSDDGTVKKQYALLCGNSVSELMLSGALSSYYDPATGLYKKDNQYYCYGSEVGSNNCILWMKVFGVSNVAPTKNSTGVYEWNGRYFSKVQKSSTSYYYFAEEYEMVLAGTVTDGQYAGDLYGKKLSSADNGYSYYSINGKEYLDVYQEMESIDNDGTIKWCSNVYARKSYAITFSKKYHKLTWTAVTNKTMTQSGGKPVYVGYQVEANGKLVSEQDNVVLNGSTPQYFSKRTSYISDTAYASGETVKYRVRAIYYTQLDTYYNVVAVGPWSETLNYSYTANSADSIAVPTVKNLKVKQKSNGTFTLNWDAVTDASCYYIQCYTSETEVSSAELANKTGWWNCATPSENKKTLSVYDSSFYSYGDKERYIYLRVCAAVEYDNDKYSGTKGGYSNIVSVRRTGANVPQVKNLEYVKLSDGDFKLRWDKVDDRTKIRIYYSTDKKLMQGKTYLYQLVDPVTLSNKETKLFSSDDQTYVKAKEVAGQVAIAAARVSYVELAGTKTECDSFNFADMKLGQTYYFVAVTYDSKHYRGHNASTSPYSITRKDKKGTTETLKYEYYTDISAKSNMASGKQAVNIAKPRLSATKDSISIHFTEKSSAVTGYQIYRKNSKGKYKKVATVSSDTYVDKKLKADTNYKYKARAYAYDTQTKKTAYSPYVYFNADTSQSNYMVLKAEMASKTSVKLTWKSVKNVVKYEIYRNYTTSSSDVYSKENTSTNSASNQKNTKSVLVKTITNSKTTSYTDKKLEQGNSYSYTIYAYYKDAKSGKVKELGQGVASINLELATPTNLIVKIQGKTAKVTWNPNKYAKKYEISYQVSNSAGEPYTRNAITKTTKKNSYTINAGLKTGDKIEVSVRCCGTNEVSLTASTTETKKLSVVKGVKVKAAGNKVKISWKAVSGAKYYKVYRSTSPAYGYDEDYKCYKLPNDATAILKERNDDETYNTVLYQQYHGISNSVKSTSVTDASRLDAGVTYYYYVRAYSDNGSTIASYGYNKPVTYSYKLTAGVKKVKAAKGKTTLTLSKVKGAKSYEIYRSTSKDKGYKKIATSKKTTYVDKTTKKGKTYYYKVVAKGTNALKGDFTTAKSSAKKVKAK